MADNFRHLVRVANTDLDGNRYPVHALTKIKGVGTIFANAVCAAAGVDKKKKIGDFSDDEIRKLDSVVRNPLSAALPTWMLNRRRDYETGEDKHIIGGDLTFQKDNDLKRLKKIKCYRGMRHAFGLTCRGQRTKSNFRYNKKKGALGVKRKK